MATLNAYLHFNDDKCREAMNFYQSILGGELTFQTLGESPMAKDVPPEAHAKIMHAHLRTPTLEFFGSDMMRDRAVIGDQISLTLNCTSKKEIETLFAKLSEGGEVFMPLEDAFWGATFGVVTDKYGMEWMLNFPKEAAK